jgi:hypothetical protein
MGPATFDGPVLVAAQPPERIAIARVMTDARALKDAPPKRRERRTSDIRGTPFNEDATGTNRLDTRDTELTAAYWAVMVKRALTRVAAGDWRLMTEEAGLN